MQEGRWQSGMAMPAKEHVFLLCCHRCTRFPPPSVTHAGGKHL